MGRPHHLARDHYRGYARHFLTFCTDRRRRVFEDATLVAAVGSHFFEAADAAACAVSAYCFMPDHVHLLVEGTAPRADARRFICLAKQRSGFFFRRQCGGRLWQPDYFDRALRNDEATIDVLRYIVENPIRAGLVVRACDYPHWGAQHQRREDILDELSRHAPRRG